MRAQARARTRGRQAGYSLIELVMALVVVGVALPPMITIGNQCLQNMHQGAYVTAEVSLAQEKLEQLIADEASAGRGYSYIVSANYPAENPITGFTGYSRSVTIAADSTYNSMTFRNVKVTVTGPDGTSANLSTWLVQ